MTLTQLTYFCTAARYLNFNQAAKSLFISQPTLSKAITALEEELGFYLFDRKGKYIYLTKYGQIYYEQIQSALDIIHTATESTRQLTQKNAGHIDIAYNPPFAQGFVPDSVSQFLASEKGLHITVQFNQASSTQIVRGILDKTYDVGFLTMIPDFPGLTFIPLMSEEMVIITPSRHPLTARKSIRLSELEVFPFVTYISEAGLRPIVDNYLNEAMIAPAISCTAPDERSIASLVASGVGIALVANVKALDDFSIHKLKICDLKCERTIYLTYDNNRYLTPAVQNYIAFIRHLVKN